MIQLNKQILSTFSDVWPDQTQTLHQAQYTGDFGMSSDFSHADYRAAAKKDTYNTWQDIPYDDVLACDAALTFATAQNFVFFMAATLFHAASALAAENLDDELISRVIFQLTYQPEPETGLGSRFALFTTFQQQIILQFFVDCQQLATQNMENGSLFEPLFNVAEIPIIISRA